MIEPGSPTGADLEAVTSTFVGRETEVVVLQTALDQARRGRGGLVLIGGEPGIGKTRLTDEFVRDARRVGAHVLWGKCWEGAGAPSYWPWIQVLRGFLRDTEPSLAREMLGPGAADIAQMLPEVHALLPDLPAALPDSDSARFQLFDSTSSLFQRIGEASEAVVVIDDLHAADTPSILLLRFMATQLHAMRVLIVGTYRDVELSPDHPLFTALNELAREPVSQTIALKGLRQESVGELIEMNTGVAVADPLVREMWRETSGNPLFLSEALRLLASEERLGDAAGAGRLRLSVPAGVREVITRRLSQLSPETIAALTTGATLGPEFSTELLHRVADTSRQQMLELIDEAVRAGLVEPLPTTTDSFRFSHDLVRESLYDDQPPIARANLHRWIAQAIEAEYASTLDEHLAPLAYHYFEAAQGAGAEESRDIALKAYDYARRAAKVASSGLAYEEAARLFRIGLAALDLARDDRDQLRGQLLIDIGEVEARTGDMESAHREFLAAAALYRRLGDARQLAVAALGYSGRFPWARPGADSTMIPLLQEALVLLGSGDQRLRARLLTRLACALRSSPEERQQSDNLSRQALEIATQLDDRQTLGYSMIGRFYATFWPENFEERSILAREAFAIAEETGDAELTVDALVVLWLSDSERARNAAIRSTLDRVTRLAHELRQPAQLWLGIGPRALTELMEGNFDVAAELIETELEEAYPFSTARDDVSAGRMQDFLLAREKGELARVEAGTRGAVEEFPWYPVHRAALAVLLFDLGRTDESRDVFGALATDSFRAIYRDNEWLLGMSLAAEACYLLEDRSNAEILYGQLAPFSGRHAIGHPEGSVGSVDRYLGLLSMTLGNTNRAIAHLRAAVEINESMLARPWAARAKHDLALALATRGTASDLEQAAQLREAALETARLLGMSVLMRQLAPGVDTPVAAEDAPTESTGTEIPSSSPAVFRLEGEYWTIEFGSDRFRLRDGKGLRYLARLLAAPGQELYALDLAHGATEHGSIAERFEAGLTSDALGDAGAVLDTSAKQAYRERVDELRAEMDEAETWNDPERATRAREEIDFITRELAAAVGLGGRDRASASPSERARVSVTRAIRLAMARVAENSTALGAHFEATIHTGTYCAYRPDPRLPLTWKS